MANCITRHIPNAVTCCNLFSGCIASVMAFNEDYTLAISFIILGAVFDFFDGMLARLFKVSGPLGKELDSLADDITFGFAPSAIVFSLFKEVHYLDFLLPVADYMPYTAFLISVFSALRLGKFNIDPRQSSGNRTKSAIFSSLYVFPYWLSSKSAVLQLSSCGISFYLF